MTLARFELTLALRRGSLPVAAALFALLAAGTTALGLASFRQLGLGSVSPAAATLLNLALLFPSAYALVVGGTSLHGDRDGGLLAMLRAAGVRRREIIAAKVLAVFVPGALVVLAGTGATAIVLAGSVALADLVAFLLVALVALLLVATTSALGVALAALVRGRQQASMVAVALWFALAIGVDLFAMAITPVWRTGMAGMVALEVADPLEGARILGLLALGADARVLGPVGGLLRETLGLPLSMSILAGAQLAWAALAAAVAARALRA